MIIRSAVIAGRTFVIEAELDVRGLRLLVEVPDDRLMVTVRRDYPIGSQYGSYLVGIVSAGLPWMDGREDRLALKTAIDLCVSAEKERVT